MQKKSRDQLATRRLGLGVDPRERLSKIIPELEREGVIVLPTDTIYGLSCRWDSRAARARVKTLKGPGRLGVFVSLVADRDMAFRYAERPSPDCMEVLESAWPGPVTAMLTVKRDSVPDFCYGADNTVAFRLPNSPFLQELSRGVGTPIISTSANLTGEPHCESVEEAWGIFGDAVDLYVDGGPQEALASTMVDLTGPRPRMLRVGLHALRGLQLEGDPFKE